MRPDVNVYAKLRFSVRRKVDIDEWVREGEELLDLRKAGPFRGTGELRRRAAEELEQVWSTGSGSAVAEAIKEFSAKYSNSFRQQARVERDNHAAYRQWARTYHGGCIVPRTCHLVIA
jgi:hypothetical protein